MISLRLESNTKAFEDEFEKWSQRRKDVLRKALRLAAEEIKDEAIRVARDDNITYTGSFARNLRVTSEKRRLTATVESTAPHAQFVELGRGPGGNPPVHAIARWAQTKLGLDTTTRQGRRILFAIVRKIGRSGTEGYKVLENALQRITSRRRIRAVLERELGEYVDEFEVS